MSTIQAGKPIHAHAFGEELRAAGIGRLPISWGPDGTVHLGRLTPEQVAALEAVIAAHDADAADDADRVEAIKAAANARILFRLPLWKQSNYHARMHELSDIRLDGGTLTAEQSAEVATFRALWAWVKSVRATSDNAEASGITAEDVVWPVAP